MHILLKFYPFPYLDLKLDIEIPVNVDAEKAPLFMQQNMEFYEMF